MLLNFAKAFDITFEKDGTVYHTLNDDVKITIRLLDETVDEEMNVVHIGNTSERMETTAEGDTLTFSSDSFSVYIVTKQELTRTYTFMNGEAVYSRQILKNGETLAEPLAPVRNGTVFRYWSTEEGGDEFTGFGAVTVTESDCAPVTLHAVYEADNIYVTFYDQEGAVVQREAIRRPTGSETVTFDTAQVDYIPMQTRSDVYLKFRFWVQGLAELGEHTPHQVGNHGVITLDAQTKDIDLYPVVAEGHTDPICPVQPEARNKADIRR